MNMHAMNMWLTDAATVVVGRIGRCTHGVTTMLGMSLRARRDTTQVMFGVSLRARCDTTLVIIIILSVWLYHDRTHVYGMYDK